MRKWGIVISVFYVLVLLGFVIPFVLLIAGAPPPSFAKFLSSVRDYYQDAFFWVPAAILSVSQALLLFLSVDTSQKRLKPRVHILVSLALAALLTALLSTAIIWSLGSAVGSDKFFEFFDNLYKHLFGNEDAFPIFWLLVFWGALWLLWVVLFYVYFRNSSTSVTRLVSWLLRGSVLELLIAVPCHIIVRRRHDCCAPAVTSFGIAAGLAVMLLSFGPSVLFLYKKRLDSYSRPH
jgi:hypothetical protein